MAQTQYELTFCSPNSLVVSERFSIQGLRRRPSGDSAVPLDLVVICLELVEGAKEQGGEGLLPKGLAAAWHTLPPHFTVTGSYVSLRNCKGRTGNWVSLAGQPLPSYNFIS